MTDVTSKFCRRLCARRGLTIVEVLVLIVIGAVLLGLLMPATRSAREAARRMSCSNNVKQLGLALHNYHSAHQQFPSAMSGTGHGFTHYEGNANRLSGFVGLLPFIEQNSLWETISKEVEFADRVFPAMGPAPWVASYQPWRTQITVLMCPSRVHTTTNLGMTNYAFSIGDLGRQVHKPTELRGGFACRLVSTFDDFIDGTSNTMLMTEIANTAGNRDVLGDVAVDQSSAFLDNPSECRLQVDPSRPRFHLQSTSLMESGRGSRWADGAAPFSLSTIILPPNDISCAIGGTTQADGFYTAGSRHPGGAHVLMADGSVQFLAETIDTGNLSSPVLPTGTFADPGTESPYGVWGALGSRNGREELGLSDI